MKHVIAGLMTVLCAVGAQAQTQTVPDTEAYELVCLVDGGQLFIDFDELQVALKPSVDSALTLPMQTVSTSVARCPGCYMIDFTNGLPGAPTLRVVTTSSMVRTQDGRFVPGNFKASIYVNEDGSWNQTHDSLACKLNEVK